MESDTSVWLPLNKVAGPHRSKPLDAATRPRAYRRQESPVEPEPSAVAGIPAHSSRSVEVPQEPETARQRRR